MTYNENDNLSGLKAGDTLVLNDGTKHEAVEDNFFCPDCSLFEYSACMKFNCNPIWFKKIEL
jgi:hypothetical protein